MAPIIRDTKDLVRLASVAVIVPERTSLPSSPPQQADEDNGAVLNAEQRNVLFFDERLSIFVVLRLPECNEAELKSCLSQLDISVEVWANDEEGNAIRSNGSVSTNRELIFTTQVSIDDDPIAILTEEEEPTVVSLNLLWQTSLELNRPRTRFNNACVVITPIATMRIKSEDVMQDVYLEPFSRKEPSIFQPLKGMKGFEKDTPFFPISRLDKVTPLPEKDKSGFAIRNERSRAFRFIAALATRVAFMTSRSRDTDSRLMASLDIDVLPSEEVHGTIDSVDARLEHGSAASVVSTILPVSIRSRDCVTLLWYLRPHESQQLLLDVMAESVPDAISISLSATLSLSAECQPLIRHTWSTSLDFAHILQQNVTDTASNLQRSNRPASLQLNTSNSMTQKAVYTNRLNPHLRISFVAPIEPVEVGKPFAWKVLVVNNGAEVVRRLLIPLPRIQRSATRAQQYAKRHASKLSNTSFKRRETMSGNDNDTAQAILDENVVFAMQHSGAVPPQTDIISLTSELLVGPLGPNQCHEAEIKLVAFKAGIFTLDAIRVIDVVREMREGPNNPGVVVDISDLPDIIVI